MNFLYFNLVTNQTSQIEYQKKIAEYFNDPSIYSMTKALLAQYIQRQKDKITQASGDLGAHINSGIPNHAFYLAATQIGGNAWEKIGKVWYNVLVNGIKYNSNFQHMANLTFDEAGKLFGIDSGEQYAIQNAWEEVGITCSSESYENASYQAHKDYQSYGTQPHTDSKERFRAH
jgi:Thermolysin metallopeptidase, alpha-helical domain